MSIRYVKIITKEEAIARAKRWAEELLPLELEWNEAPHCSLEGFQQPSLAGGEQGQYIRAGFKEAYVTFTEEVLTKLSERSKLPKSI